MLLRDLPRVSDAIAGAIRAGLTADSPEADGPAAAPTKPFKRQRPPRRYLDAWTRLWAPYAQRSKLAAVLDGTGAVLAEPQDRADLLGSHWEAVFAQRNVHSRLADALARHIAEPLTLGEAPTFGSVLAFLRKARQTAPGPDRLPYGAWAAASTAGARALGVSP